MEKEYIKIEKPTTPFPTNTNVLKTMNDEFWKDWIFYCLLSFYEKFDRTQLNRKIENNPSRVEKTIADFIRNYLRNDIGFNGFCDFIVDRESLNEGDLEGYYDITIQHSYWKKGNQNIAFYFECKNLNGSQDLVNKYVYYKRDHSFDGGVYRYFNGKYAQQQDFGGMIGFVLDGNYLTIKTKIHEKLKQKFMDITPEGDLIDIFDNSIQNKDFTFDSYHNRFDSKFVIHHLMFNIFPQTKS